MLNLPTVNKNLRIASSLSMCILYTISNVYSQTIYVYTISYVYTHAIFVYTTISMRRTVKRFSWKADADAFVLID